MATVWLVKMKAGKVSQCTIKDFLILSTLFYQTQT